METNNDAKLQIQGNTHTHTHMHAYKQHVKETNRVT